MLERIVVKNKIACPHQNPDQQKWGLSTDHLQHSWREPSWERGEIRVWSTQPNPSSSSLSQLNANGPKPAWPNPAV